MPDFVISHKRLALAVNHGCSLHARNDAVNAVIHFFECDGTLLSPSSEDCRLSSNQNFRPISASGTWSNQV